LHTYRSLLLDCNALPELVVLGIFCPHVLKFLNKSLDIRSFRRSKNCTPTPDILSLNFHKFPTFEN
jgi:hypothetical protein